MKKDCFPLLTLLSLALLLATGASAQSPSLQVKELKLHNGLTVWLNEDHSQPKVLGAVVVKAGAADCPGTGIAHYFEHIMFKGTRHIGTIDYAAEKPWLDSISARYDELAQTKDNARRAVIQADINRLSLRAADYAIPNEFSQLISLYGGNHLNAFTDIDKTVYHNVFSPQYINQWLELNSERLIDPVFRLFQSELETVYEEKNQQSDNLLIPAVNAVQEKLFKGTPYAEPVIGTTENLKNPRLSEMADFFNRYYVAGNMGLILCGDFNSDSVASRLEQTFGRIHPGQAPVREVAKATADGETLKLKVRVPIVKAVGYVFPAPNSHSHYYKPLQLAMQLLSNSSKSGMLDSLETAGKVMAAQAMGYNMKDCGVVGFGAVPNLIFGSKKHAEKLLWQQVDRIKEGQFSDATLQTLKLIKNMEGERRLENLSSRISLMIEAFAYGFNWDDYINKVLHYDEVSKADVMEATKQYLEPLKGLRLVKKFGSYPRDQVSQPGYRPVTAKNANRHSDYADQLAKMPVTDPQPRYLNLDSDAQHTDLAPLTRLYRVQNPLNNIFTLNLTFLRKVDDDWAQRLVGDYLPLTGTDKMSAQKVNNRLKQLCATMNFQSDKNAVRVNVSGPDANLEPILQLLAQRLYHPKADKKGWKQVRQNVKMLHRAQRMNASTVQQAVISKTMLGNQSPYIDCVTPDVVASLKPDDVLRAWHEAQTWQTQIVYTGTKSMDELASLISSTLNVNQATHPFETPTPRHLQQYKENTVIVCNQSDARQTLVAAYEQLPAAPTWDDRARFLAWNQYMGGSGMNNILFQNVRELRSLAYDAHSEFWMQSKTWAPQEPIGALQIIYTQGDKANGCIELLDSLMGQTPNQENLMAIARQQLINQNAQNRPTFREMGNEVADCLLKGYTQDPSLECAQSYNQLTNNDITDYYTKHVAPAPRVYILVGNLKLIDLQKVAKYGKIVTWKSKDMFK